MAKTTVDVMVNGSPLLGWTKATWASSLEMMADELQISMPAPVGGGIVGGEQLSLKVDGGPVFRGWIEGVEARLSSDDASMVIRARSRCADLIDSSVDLSVRPSELTEVNLEAIAKEYAFHGYGIPVRNLAGDLPIVPKVSVQTGESVFDVLDRYARQAGVILRSSSDGDAVIERVGQNESAQPLVLGKNLISLNINTDLSGVFRHNKVVGQSTLQDDWGSPSAVSAEGEAVDETVRPTRLRVTQAAGPASPGECQTLANWTAAVNAARSREVTCEVVGWFSAGTLWRPNTRVYLEASNMFFSAYFLIASAVLELEADAGFTGSLTLVDKNSYLAEPIRQEDTEGMAEQMRNSQWMTS